MPKTQQEIEAIVHDLPPFGLALGLRFTTITPDRLVAEMAVETRHTNRNGVLHGGAIMAFADSIGGAAAMINLPEGHTTTTLESKTNFLRPIRAGDTAVGEATALHMGRTTHVWQTTVRRGDGKVCAIVTQTQMVIEWKEGRG